MAGSVAAIVLAAGASARMGQPKQLLLLDGRPLLERVVAAVCQPAASGAVDDVVVVLGHQADAIEAELRLPAPARIVRNPAYAAGQSTSLAAGLRALPSTAAAAVVVLGDQPGLDPVVVEQVVEAYRTEGGPVVQAAYRDRRGHPTLFDRSVWPELLALEGDVGARSLLAARPERITTVPVDAAAPGDVDTWPDYEQLVARRPQPER